MEAGTQRVSESVKRDVRAAEPQLGMSESVESELRKEAGDEHKGVVLQTPEVLASKYTYVRPLGHGTQGRVVEARRNSDGERVAIKQLRVESVSNWKSCELFQREAKALASLNLKGVAHFYESIDDLECEHPSAYIVQEYIRGKSLGDMMKAGFRFTIRQIFEMGIQLLNILEGLHKHDPQIIHRDIKPSNILLQPTQGDDYDLYLIDFGAVANPQVQQGGSTIAGTYGFMPPEQLVGNPVPASDIYALGAMLAYMLSGVEPADMRVVDFRLVIDPHLENVPRPIVLLLHQMLDPDPEKRLCNYRSLRDTFQSFAEGRFISNNDEIVLCDSDINKKLSSIMRINQPGSLDLWMQLSESTPRTLPESYMKRMNSLKCSKQESVLNYNFMENHPMLTKFVGLMTAAASAAVSGALLMGIWWAGLGMAVFVLLPIIIYLIIYLFCYITFRVKTQIQQKSRPFHKKRGEYLFRPLVEKLLTQGRKSIATIISCNYELTRADTVKLDNLTNCYVSSSEPSFVVKYKFNPSDDSSPNDLIHTIRLHHDVTHDFEPGAPLPILYYIDPEDNSHVMSMPYPLPNDPHLNIDTVIDCHSMGYLEEA